MGDEKELESLKKFEINNNILKDFDKLMSMQLNEVEELKVTEIDNNSKLLNIISLCINIKTLIIEGDQRINTNNIVLNICKPELVENLILTNVKLPNGHALKRLSNLKLISLNNIRFSNIGMFINNIPNPDGIEGINFCNVDYEKNIINNLSRFSKVKYINFEDVTNSKLENLEFLSQNNNLQKLSIINNFIDSNEINNLLKGKYIKNISLEIISSNNSDVKNTFEIDENGTVTLTVNLSKLESIIQNLNLYKIDNLNLIVDENSHINPYIKKLKNVKNKVNIAIKDPSYLSSEDATKLKERLKIENINVLNTKGILSSDSYNIDYFIKIKEEIQKYINLVHNDASNTKRFLEIYKILGENLQEDSNMYAVVLQNCLVSLNIDSNIITGKLRGTEESHLWNQVKLNDKWYNVDLGLDVQNIFGKSSLKRKVKYCLLDDRNFYETHIPESGVINYSLESFDSKIINVYFKTGLYNRSYINSYFQNILKRIKVITSFNKQKALPAGKNMDEK